jgi:hypothetical protein
MAYVDYKYYTETYGGDRIAASEAPRAFQTASNAVDSLTYCRINSAGLESLTAFQQNVIKQVTCALADWQTENADLLDNPYSSYSINGVAATWGKSAGVRQANGVMVPNRIYAELVKTGLCYPGVR